MAVISFAVRNGVAVSTGWGRLGAVGIAAVALAMVLADMQFEERPASEADTAKRTGRIRGAGQLILLTI
jgi:hypothetical protein